MVLDGLTPGKGDMKSRWSRLIREVTAAGHPTGPSAGSLVRARNAWVKQKNFGSDSGEVTVADFRELARRGIEVKMGVPLRDVRDR
jgi:hypothetical protein